MNERADLCSLSELGLHNEQTFRASGANEYTSVSF